MDTRVYAFDIGDRVRFVTDYYYGAPIDQGSTGRVEAQRSARDRPYLSRVTHATSNGGGYDLPVRLDDGRLVSVRAEGRTQYVELVERAEWIAAPVEDAWHCTCGNESHLDGFWPCLPDGTEVEPIVGGPWDERLLVCGACGRIMDGATYDSERERVLVVGQRTA